MSLIDHSTRIPDYEIEFTGSTLNLALKLLGNINSQLQLKIIKNNLFQGIYLECLHEDETCLLMSQFEGVVLKMSSVEITESPYFIINSKICQLWTTIIHQQPWRLKIDLHTQTILWHTMLDHENVTLSLPILNTSVEIYRLNIPDHCWSRKISLSSVRLLKKLWPLYPEAQLQYTITMATTMLKLVMEGCFSFCIQGESKGDPKLEMATETKMGHKLEQNLDHPLPHTLYHQFFNFKECKFLLDYIDEPEIAYVRFQVCPQSPLIIEICHHFTKSSCLWYVISPLHD